MTAGENTKIHYRESVSAILNHDVPAGHNVKGRGKRRVILQDTKDKIIKQKVITTENGKGKVIKQEVKAIEATEAEKKLYLERRQKEIELGKGG